MSESNKKVDITVKAALFDLDGTLINTLYSLNDVMNEVMDELGCDSITEEQTKQYVGKGYEVFVEKSLAATADKLYKKAEEIEEKDEEQAFELDQQADDVMDLYDDACDRYVELFAEGCTKHLVEYEGMAETLAELKSRGIKLACVTNKPMVGAIKCLDTVFGEGVFDYVSADDGTHPLKPDVGVIDDTLSHLGVDKGECIFIGDTKTDMETATNAGITSIGCAYGFRGREELEKFKADFIVDSAKEIIGLL